MNHTYSLVWNPATQSYSPAPETARRSAKGRYRKLVLALAISAACGVQAAPEGGLVVDGSASITQFGDTTNIDQSSQAVTIHWQGFDIGADETVNFFQPDASSLALNRVLTGDGTQIHGRLNANGRVFILDANGVLFGETAQVNVGSLVASTLDLRSSEGDHFEFAGDGSPASVTNLGSITAADGGAVALLGGQVNNQGIVRARLGTIALAAGNEITLDFAGDGLLQVQVDQGAARALASNGGLLQANGGNVLMTAQASDALLQTVVNNQGVIEARTLEERDGKILLLGSFEGGTVQVGGTLDASAPDGGNGGFIDTSGAIVKVQADARITAAAPQGQAGTWLIDPTDIDISYDPQGANDGQSHIHTQVLQNSLASTNVVVQTQATGGQDGNITVVDPIVWAGGASLTLDAHNNIIFNDYVHAPGGGLVLDAGNTISTGPEGHINVGTFTLVDGDWRQVTANLPVFIARDFRLDGGTFIRALGGSGTSGSPWQISDIYGLQGMALEDAGVHIRLVNDIDATTTANWYADNAGFRPIGTQSNAFNGSLDGQGFVINGLTINRPSQNMVGLLGHVGNLATIQDVGLTNVSVAGGNNVGSLIGVKFGGLVSDSYAEGQVSGGLYVGGLIGVNVDGDVTSSYANATVSGNNDVGGLVGRFQGTTTLSNSYATGNVTATGENAGGLVGNLYQGTVNDSFATGAVTGDNNVGGLVGNNTLPSEIARSYASGRVTGATNAGGLVGLNFGEVHDSYWDSYTTGMGATGVGQLGGVNIFNAAAVNGEWGNGQDAYSQSTYVGFDFANTWFIADGHSRPMLRAFLNDAVGGVIAIDNLYQLQGMAANLAGNYILTGNIDASATASGNVSDTWGGRGFAPVGNNVNRFTGSLDGQGFVIDGLTINRGDSSNVGLFGRTGTTASLTGLGLENVDITGGDYTGGLVGDNTGSITQSYATGVVEGRDVVGGLVGGNTGSITQSYATGTVEGSGWAGGLVGWNTGDITQSYATGGVEGSINVGGLVGQNIFGNITQSYATGLVESTTGSTDVGGLVGISLGIIATSYWDTATTNQSQAVGNVLNHAGATAVNGNWSVTPTAYNQASYAGFDFTDVWYMAEGYSRPMLRTFLNYITSGGTYQITNALQLQGMVADLAGNYVLMNDIDASVIAATGNTSDVWGGRGFAPVGSWDAGSVLAFSGSFDGDGHVISGLVSDRPDQDYVGLFGRTSTTAVIENVGLLNVDLRGDDNVGAVAGWHWGQMSGVYATGAVAAESSQAGGLVGGNSGAITDSYAIVAVDAVGDNAGGLVGLQEADGSITRTYALGGVSAGANAGGLVGNNDGTITDSFFLNTVGAGVGTGSNAGVTGLASADFTQLSSFAAWGSNINADGSGSALWRIYEGQSAPLLRSFLTDIEVIAYDAEKVYDGGTFDGHHDINGTTGNGVRYGTNYAQFLAVFGENGTPYGVSDDVGSADLRYTGNAQGAVNAGTYELGVDGLHSHQLGYNILFTPGELEVTPAPLVVDVTMGVNNASKIYGNADPIFTWNLVSGTLAPGDQATGIFSRTAGENVGNYTITATPTGDFATNYNVTVNNGVFTITPRPITLTVADASKIYGDLDPDFAWAVTQGNLVFSDSLSGSFTRAPGENVGDYAISATPTGTLASNYAVTLVNGTLTITPRDLVIDISNLDKIYGDADPEFTWAISQGSVVNGDQLELALTRDPGENVGSYAITANGEQANSNYSYTINEGVLTISPRPLVLTADNLVKVYGEEDPELTWQITNGTLVGDDTLVVSVSRDDGSNVGVYAIRLSGAVEDNSNYVLTMVDGQLQITPAPLTVTANNVTNYWDLLPPFTATVDGLVNGDTEAGVLGNSLTVTSNLTLPLPGNYVLTPNATQIGNNYTINFVEGVLTLLSSNPGGNYIDALTGTQLPAREALGREGRANIFEGRALLDGQEEGAQLLVLDGGIAIDPDQLAAWGIRFPETVFFPVNSSTVGQQYFAELRNLVEQLKRYPQVQLLVEGHTCNSGTLELNQRLSQARANAVAKVLTEMGLEEGRVRAQGYDFQKPIADNRTPEGRTLNRRAEMLEDEGQ